MTGHLLSEKQLAAIEARASAVKPVGLTDRPNRFQALAADVPALLAHARALSVMIEGLKVLTEERSAENKKLRDARSRLNDEVMQTLGKALGYLWYKDDPVNFPNATEANGICPGDMVAEAMAEQAANRIRELLNVAQAEAGRRAATTHMFQRYLDIVRRYLDDTTNDDGRLGWLCQTAIEQGATMPLDKLSRWLGFVQGQLEALELITIDGERDYSRPLFHAAYKKDGIPPPETQEFPNAGSAPSKAARRRGRPVIENSGTPTGYDYDD